MGTDVTHIDDFVKRLAARSQHLAAAAKNGNRTAPNHISTKQNRFWYVTDEDPKPTPDPLALNFSVIEIKKPRARYFYEGPYVEGTATPPTCMSQDGVAPEANIESPQAAACASCPRAEWGSAVGLGGAPRAACKVYKQLVVKVAGLPGMWLFSLPPGSLGEWDTYAKSIEAAAAEEARINGYDTLSLLTCVTKATFDPKRQGVLKFSPLGYIGNRKLMAEAECQELEELCDKSDAIADMLWGPNGKAREQQYLSGDLKRLPSPATTMVTPKVPEPEVDAAPAAKRQANGDSKAGAANPSAVASKVIADLGLDLDE
ncbi:MAG: hypothetical protein MN733_44100 [Nitrososphaera sp.]|nr:hypothetical protein [Nitrososphaera sp.]